jgi:hypothetical protein
MSRSRDRCGEFVGGDVDGGLIGGQDLDSNATAQALLL